MLSVASMAVFSGVVQVMSGLVGSSTLALASGATLSSTLTVTSAAAFSGPVSIAGSLLVSGTATFGSAFFSNTLIIGSSVSTLAFDPEDDTLFWLRDDFAGGGTSDGTIGELGWRLNSAGAGAAPLIGALRSPSNHPGVLTVSTTATSGQGGTLTLVETAAGTTAVFSGLASAANWSLTAIFRLVVSGGATFAVGLIGSATVSNPTEMIALRYDTANGDTQFNLACLAGGASAVVSLGAVDSAYHKVRIRQTTVGTVLASLDSGTELAITTSANIPSLGLSPTWLLVTHSAVSKVVVPDFFALKVRGLSR
jgi:hypothetical protein